MHPRIRRVLQRASARIEPWVADVRQVRSGDPLAENFAYFGARSRIDPPLRVVGSPSAVAIGDDVRFWSGVTLEPICPIGAVMITIADRTQIGYGTRLVAVNGIEIAPDCGIAHGVTVADTVHTYKAEDDVSGWQAGLRVGRPLRIEQGVWIGNNTIVSGGITIGERSIISANCFINRDVPPNTLVGGNPSRVWRRRDEQGEWHWVIDPSEIDLDPAPSAS